MTKKEARREYFEFIDMLCDMSGLSFDAVMELARATNDNEELYIAVINAKTKEMLNN